MKSDDAVDRNSETVLDLDNPGEGDSVEVSTTEESDVPTLDR